MSIANTGVTGICGSGIIEAIAEARAHGDLRENAEYDAAKKDMIKRLGKQPEDFFLTRKLTREKFKNIVEWSQKYTFFGSPIFLEFLRDEGGAAAVDTYRRDRDAAELWYRLDADGNPITANLMDYAIPSAAELPSFEAYNTETPTHLNPLGAKGIGESGTIGATPAVQNAVIDALSIFGITNLDESVRAAFPGAAIIRPSIVFGREDQFINRFAGMVAKSPVVPVLRAPVKFQPVFAADVGDAMANATGVDLTLDDFTRIGKHVPMVADLKPSGRYQMAELIEIGGRGGHAPLDELQHLLRRAAILGDFLSHDLDPLFGQFQLFMRLFELSLRALQCLFLVIARGGRTVGIRV